MTMTTLLVGFIAAISDPAVVFVDRWFFTYGDPGDGCRPIQLIFLKGHHSPKKFELPVVSDVSWLSSISTVGAAPEPKPFTFK